MKQKLYNVWVQVGGMVRVWVRERLARVKLFLDLAFGKRPKFLGERIEIETDNII